MLDCLSEYYYFYLLAAADCWNEAGQWEQMRLGISQWTQNEVGPLGDLGRTDYLLLTADCLS